MDYNEELHRLEEIERLCQMIQAENENNGNAEGETAASSQTGRPLVINTLTWAEKDIVIGINYVSISHLDHLH